MASYPSQKFVAEIDLRDCETRTFKKGTVVYRVCHFGSSLSLRSKAAEAETKVTLLFIAA